MSEELKPCWDCGSPEVEVGVVDTYGLAYWVECTACGACTGQHYNERDAIDAWNRPAENAVLRDRIDALEWLREVENVDRTMSEWHPDKGKKKKEASDRRDNAWIGLCHICQNARESVGS